jgi:hypothetical protein
MGNIIEKFTNEGDPNNDTDTLKSQVEDLMIPAPVIREIVPNEEQYGEDAAYGIVAFKNQNPNGMSDLDLERTNFEEKYKNFLNWYGQYSNVPITNLSFENDFLKPLTINKK